MFDAGAGDVIDRGALTAVTLGGVGSCLSKFESERLAAAGELMEVVSGTAADVAGIVSDVELAAAATGGETGGAIGVGCGVGVDTDAGCGAGIASIVCVPASS